MPNHCDNRLTVTGDPATLKKFVEFARPDEDCQDGKDQPLDYNKLCPMPPDPYQQIVEGESCSLHAISVHMGEGTPLQRLQDENVDESETARLKQGAWWYWRIEHWGTKWNCYDGYGDTADLEAGKVVYNFQSAWSPPTGVIRAAAERFDTLKFVLEYAEPGCSFSGVMEAIGDVCDDECFDDVLATAYGQELYQESFDEMAEEEERERQEQESESNA